MPVAPDKAIVDGTVTTADDRDEANKHSRAMNLRTPRTLHRLAGVLACALVGTTATRNDRAQSRYEKLSGLPFEEGYVRNDDAQR